MIEKILVNGRVVLVSSSKTQLSSCFDAWANNGNEDEVTCLRASIDELNEWVDEVKGWVN